MQNRGLTTADPIPKAQAPGVGIVDYATVIARLEVHDGTSAPVSFAITKSTTVIGRMSPPADIALEFNVVSKIHLSIHIKPNGAVFIEDHGSSNGTFLHIEDVKTAIDPKVRFSLKQDQRVDLGNAAKVFFFLRNLRRPDSLSQEGDAEDETPPPPKKRKSEGGVALDDQHAKVDDSGLASFMASPPSATVAASTGDDYDATLDYKMDSPTPKKEEAAVAVSDDEDDDDIPPPPAAATRKPKLAKQSPPPEETPPAKRAPKGDQTDVKPCASSDDDGDATPPPPAANVRAPKTVSVASEGDAPPKSEHSDVAKEAEKEATPKKRAPPPKKEETEEKVSPKRAPPSKETKEADKPSPSPPKPRAPKAAVDDDDNDSDGDSAEASTPMKKREAKKKPGFKWQFKSDLRYQDSTEKAWSDYGEPENSQLETLFQKYDSASKTAQGTKKIQEPNLNSTYAVNFKQMFQFRLTDTERQRPIRRVTL